MKEKAEGTYQYTSLKDCCKDLWDMLLMMLHLKKKPELEGEHE